MTSNRKNWAVSFVTLLVIGVPVLVFLKTGIVDDDQMTLMLRVTARTSFLIYLLVFIARPLRQLLDLPLTRTLLKNRRYHGIAFAGSHTVHLLLIIWYFAVLSESGPDIPTLVVGGTGYALLYLMLATSFDRPAAAIGPAAWRRLHKTGLYWLGGVFAITFVPKFLAHPGDPTYLAATILTLAAVIARILAYSKRKKT